jgi:hypothetical protein
MGMLWILDYGHPDHGGPAPLTLTDRQAFADFAGIAAAHYKHKNVIGFEIWNEPNYEHYWPAADPVTYGELLGEAAVAIKRNLGPNSPIRVLSGGITVPSVKGLTWLARLAQTGKLSAVDVVAIHPYRASMPETFAADMAPIRAVLNANGIPASVWVSEWGYGSYGYIDSAIYGNGTDARAQRRHGVLTIRQVLTQLAMNVRLATIYELVDGGTNPTDRESNFGLLRQDFSDKPAMTGLRTLYSFAKSRTFKGPISNMPGGSHAVRWDGEKDRAFAVWVDTAGVSTTVNIPNNATSITRWDGSPAPILETTLGRALQLNEGDGPIFLTIPN